jgi:hypothetical protein
VSFEAQHFFPIMPSAVAVAWPHIEPLLAEFTEKTCLITPADVLKQATQGEVQLWAYHDGEFRAVVATRIYTNAVGRVCQLYICIGHDVSELLEGGYLQIERWARDIGCYAMEIVGRKGWLRALPGFAEKAVVMEKRLVEAH